MNPNSDFIALGADDDSWCRCVTEWECQYFKCNRLRVVSWDDFRFRAAIATQKKLEVWETELRGAPYDLKQLQNANMEFRTLSEAILQPFPSFIRYLENIQHRLRISLSDSEKNHIYNQSIGVLKQSFVDVLVHLVEKIISGAKTPRKLYGADVTGGTYNRDKLVSLTEEFQDVFKRHLLASRMSLAGPVWGGTNDIRLPTTFQEHMILYAAGSSTKSVPQNAFQEIENSDAITQLPMSGKTLSTRSAIAPVIEGDRNFENLQSDTMQHEQEAFANKSRKAYPDIRQFIKDSGKDSSVGKNDRRDSNASQHRGERSRMKPTTCFSTSEDKYSEFDPQNESDFELENMFDGISSKGGEHDMAGPTEKEDNTLTRSNSKKIQRKKAPAKRRR